MHPQGEDRPTQPLAADQAPQASLIRRLLAPLRWLAGLLLVLILLFEEWGWGPLHRAMAWLGRLPLLRQIETWIAGLPPYGALALFLLPSVSLLPIKLLALWLIGQGHAGLGLAVIVAAKLAGTAILARLFTLTQPALMRLTWFARLYSRWMGFKKDLLARVRASAPWRAAAALRGNIAAAARGWMSALRRLLGGGSS